MQKLNILFRRGIYALTFLVFFITASAQTEVNTSFSDRMNYVFGSLEKPRVPNGLLLDYAMEFTNLSNYSGATLVDSNMVMPAEFWEIYNTLYLSRIHPNGFTIQHPQLFDSLWFTQRTYGQIVLAGLFYNYSRFRDDAVQTTRITVQNDQVHDRYIGGVWQNPYQTEKVFALSPSLEYYEGKNLQVVLPTSMWQTNAASEISNLSIDFGDGQGYRNVTPGQPLTLQYADTGMKVWNYRLQLTNNQYLYSHSQVHIKNAVSENACVGCRFGATIQETIPITADEAFNGAQAQGFITIHYRDADRGLRRPLIVAEGFDVGHITSPELQFGSNTIIDFYRSVNSIRSGSNNIDDIIRNMPQYDIIYVDWRNGTDFLQRNGLLLETIIRWVNANKEPLPGGGYADNVVLGQSMGGVISRWALRDMETRLGQQHHTRLFVSMDAPQQGANVPTALQHLARHARSLYLQTAVSGIIETIQWITGGASPLRILSLADQPASRQMLINWVNVSGNIDNTVHDQWEGELQSLGYPTQNSIRNIAISNGTECGSTQPFAPGAELLNVNGKANTRFLGDLLGMSLFPIAGILTGQPGFLLGIIPGRNDIKYEFIANAQPQQGTSQRIYRGKISYTKKVLWLVPVTVTITERNNNNNSSLLPTDYYPGGAFGLPINGFSSSFQNALVKFNISFSLKPSFCFVPTPSALDIGSNNVALTNADYLIPYVGGVPPTGVKSSPFQNFVTAFNFQRVNEEHIGFYQRNGDWLAQELTSTANPPASPPVANCSNFCNSSFSISGSNEVCGGAMYSVPDIPGATYSWTSVPANALFIDAPNSLQTSVYPNINGPITLRLTISTADCGTITLNKSLTVVPVFEVIDVEFSSNGLGASGEILCNHDYDYDDYANTFKVILNSPNGNQQLDLQYMILDMNTGQSMLSYPGIVTIHNVQHNGTYSLPPSLPAGMYNIKARLVGNICGENPTMWFEDIMEYQDCHRRREGLIVSVYPNPIVSGSALQVTVDDANLGQQKDKSEKVNFSLHDMYSQRVIRTWTGSSMLKQHNLNVSGISSGQYILVVTKGDQKQSKHIQISK